MTKKKKPAKPRLAQRKRARAVEKLVRDQAKLAKLEVGGTAERPIDVTSAALVEPRALDLGCLHCEARPRVERHDAVVVGDRPLRRVRLACPACGSEREVWLRIVSAEARLN